MLFHISDVLECNGEAPHYVPIVPGTASSTAPWASAMPDVMGCEFAQDCSTGLTWT